MDRPYPVDEGRKTGEACNQNVILQWIYSQHIYVSVSQIQQQPSVDADS